MEVVVIDIMVALLERSKNLKRKKINNRVMIMKTQRIGEIYEEDKYTYLCRYFT